MVRRWMFAGRMSTAAAVTAALLVAAGGAAFGATPKPTPTAEPAEVPAVHGVRDLPTRFAKPVKPPKSFVPARTTWPAAASTVLTLGSSGARVDGHGVPVWAHSARLQSLRVKVLDHSVAEAAGVPGVLLTVSAEKAGPARVGVNYRDFAEAYGGNYGSRLGLVSYPACLLTTPDRANCRTATPLATENDFTAKTVSATVALPAAASAMVLAAATTPGPGDDGAAGGTYSASDLSPSGSWAGGGGTGDFTYSYPIALPSAPSALTPTVSLSYNSGATDGENATTQPQSSWVGEGWNTPDSFIEQAFQSCAESPEGSAAPTKIGDACYDGPIYRLSLGGSSSALVWDATRKVFKTEDADGSIVKHYCTLPSGATSFTDPTCVAGAGNAGGTKFNDWWQIVDRSGTRYSFGMNHLPGWTSGKAATGSVATKPVFSAHSGDPCYSSSGFSSSWCTMPYRWGLDYTTDAHGNAMAYYYKQDTNFYGSYNGATMRSYVRDQHLDHIDYGFTDGNAYGTVPDQVTFKTGPRCVTGTCTPLDSSTKANWPDVPYDMICASGAKCTKYAAAFFATVRLTSIVTSQYSLTSKKQEPIDTYVLGHSMPQTGDGTSPTLWLDQVQRTGSALNAGPAGGLAKTMPPVTFAPSEQMNSRLDTVTDGLPAFKKYRLQKITTETGSVITVGYKLPNPCSASAKPAADTNKQSCYPVKWTPAGYTAPITDWFNKYAVAQVSQTDPTGGASAATTSYDYVGGAAWHYDDNELVKAKNRTYGQFRGYGDVVTYLGDGVTDAKAKSEITYYRGMSKNNSGAVVNVTDSQGGVHEDLNQLAGSKLEISAFLGNAVDHSTITSYWVSAPAATRTRTGLPDLTSTWSAPVETFTRQAVTSGGSTTWRYTQTDTSFNDTVTDAGFGLVTREYSHTEPVDPAYDRCTTTTYAPVNAARNLVGLPASVEVDSVACGGFVRGSKPSAPGSLNTLTAPASVSRPDQVVSATRSFYDDTTFASTFPQTTVPSTGDVTMAQQASGYTGGAFTWQTKSRAAFDSVGRPTDAYDANGNHTVTAYAANSIGLITGATVTNPLGQATSTTLDVQRGLTLTSTDLNKVVTTRQHDALGRITAVWLADRAIGTPANFVYSYVIANNGPTAVTTMVLNEELGYRSQTTIYDGLFRPRQTQTESPRGGRLVTDTFYDTRGWVSAKYTNWFDSANTPGVAVASAADLRAEVPTQNIFTRNSLGDTVIDSNRKNGVEISATTTVHSGDRTTVVPPAGGTVTTTVVDPLGRTTAIQNYLNRPTINIPTDPFTGAFTVTGGTSQVISYGYDSHGNQSTTTQGAAGSSAPTWTSTFNLLGQVTGKTDPDAGAGGAVYDGNGNLVQSTDARGKTISYRFDALNRKTGMFASTVAAQQPADPSSGSTGNQLGGWVYDNANNVAGVTHALGQLTTTNTYVAGHTYSAQQLDFNVFEESAGLSVTIPGIEGNLARTYTVKRTYTPNVGLPQRDLYQSVGGLPAEQVLHTYRSQFDLADGLAGSAGYTQTTSYDALSRVNMLKFGPTASVFTTLTNTFDANSGRLVDRSVNRTDSGVTTAIDKQTYAYDLAGNITGQTSTRQATAETQCYGYDGLDQLTAAWTANDGCARAPSATDSSMVADALGAGAAYWTTWTIDGLGDRTGQTVHAFAGGPAADAVTTYRYGNAGGTQPHALTSTSTAGAGSTGYSYDVAGNMKTRNAGQGNQTLAYDDAGHLTAVTGSSGGDSGYVYDANGELLLQKNPGSTTLYLGNQQFTLNTATGAVSGARYYRLPDGSLAIRTGSTSTAFGYAITDPHGTAGLYLDSATTTPTWRQYTPYGDARGAAVTAPDNRGFLNKPMDTTTGLTLVGARQYDPAAGRFVTDDPVLEVTDPTQLNGYGYAGNNPIGKSDPTGLMVPLDERVPGRMANGAPQGSTGKTPTIGGPRKPTSHTGPGPCWYVQLSCGPHGGTGSKSPFVSPLRPCDLICLLAKKPASTPTDAAHQQERSDPGILHPTPKPAAGAVEGGGMHGYCAGLSLGFLATSTSTSFCVAIDSHGIGVTATDTKDMIWAGGGASVSFGKTASNGSIRDQAGESYGGEAGVEALVGADVSVYKSATADVYTISQQRSVGFATGVGSVATTETSAARWDVFDDLGVTNFLQKTHAIDLMNMLP